MEDVVAKAAADWWVSRVETSDDRQQQALREALSAVCAMHHDEPIWSLVIDYGPQGDLADVFRRAGVAFDMVEMPSHLVMVFRNFEWRGRRFRYVRVGECIIAGNYPSDDEQRMIDEEALVRCREL